MSELKRLAGITHLSHSQQRVVDHLWQMNGICSGCETPLAFSSPKFAMGVVNTSYCAIPEVRNTIGISIYCADCTEKLSGLIRALRPPKPMEAAHA